jgi:hypothetical protein
MPRGENLNRDRKPGPGRPKGLKNRLTVELKQMIEGALEEVGGQAYLVSLAKKRPELFCQLLSKLLPKSVDLGGTLKHKHELNFRSRLESARQRAMEETQRPVSSEQVC